MRTASALLESRGNDELLPNHTKEAELPLCLLGEPRKEQMAWMYEILGQHSPGLSLEACSALTAWGPCPGFEALAVGCQVLFE